MDVICIGCQKVFAKKISQIKKSPNHFCSRSCAATYNNKLYVKRKSSAKQCAKCHVSISGRRKLCDKCLYVDWSIVTIGSIAESAYQRFARVRKHARSVYKNSDRPKCCAYCGYSRHYEVCHVREISSFALSTSIAVVNRIENLVALCPTHHWEFDHGYLDILRSADEIRTHMDSVSLSPR